MKKFIPDASCVKLLGRSITENDTLWCALSASGIEFQANCKHLSVNLLGDDKAPGTDFNLARFAIYINDERIIDKCINFDNQEFVIIDSDIPVSATIRILKLSEAPMSIMGIGELTTDDEGVITPVPPKAKTVEFIGDSITCGYGVDAPNELTPFSTATEDPTKAYAYLTAKALDWDYSLVSYSGHGIISGYTEGDVPYTDELVAPFYPMVGHSFGTLNGEAITNQDWSFSSFTPDYVIINLGTNDDSYCRDYKDRQETFRDEYVNFIKMVRSKNPDSRIVCILGLMGDRLYPYVSEAVSIYKAATADNNIFCFALTPQDPANGYGADYHPSAVSHQLAAKQLLEYLSEII